MPATSQTLPPQHQNQQPGLQSEMNPIPASADRRYKGAGKLLGKTAIITGGDSGIGRSVAIHYAREGVDVAIVYLNEHQDAADTKRMVEEERRQCVTIAGDIGEEALLSNDCQTNSGCFRQTRYCR